MAMLNNQRVFIHLLITNVPGALQIGVDWDTSSALLLCYTYWWPHQATTSRVVGTQVLTQVGMR